MLNILYEDSQILTAVKPAGMEAQSARGFEADMVSEIKGHINKLCPENRDPYVGVIHRLDKPVSGVMVYAKTPKAAAALSRQVQSGEMKKIYKAVACGKLVDNVGKYVDYLLKDGKSNSSRIVDKGITGAKRAELNYRTLESVSREDGDLTLVEVELVTGRHHQIRAQFAGHGTPLWGDRKYNPLCTEGARSPRGEIALCACRLSFFHPESGKQMEFSVEPEGEAFSFFQNHPENPV